MQHALHKQYMHSRLPQPVIYSSTICAGAVDIGTLLMVLKQGTCGNHQQQNPHSRNTAQKHSQDLTTYSQVEFGASLPPYKTTTKQDNTACSH
jgi:hypothetical protein